MSNPTMGDVIIEQMERLSKDYDGVGRFNVGEGSYSPSELVEHLKADDEIGREFAGNLINAMIAFLMSFE